LALNRQAVVMARHGVPIRAVGSDRLNGPAGMSRSGARIAPVVDRMAVLLKSGTTRICVPSREFVRMWIFLFDYAGFDLAISHSTTEPVGIITLVDQQLFGGW